MPNWTWWQWLFAGALAGSILTTVVAWICGRKAKAPGDAGTSDPEQTKLVDPIILRHAEKVKRRMRGDRK